MPLGDIADNTTLKHTTKIGSPVKNSTQSRKMAREVSSTVSVHPVFLSPRNRERAAGMLVADLLIKVRFVPLLPGIIFTSPFRLLEDRLWCRLFHQHFAIYIRLDSRCFTYVISHDLPSHQLINTDAWYIISKHRTVYVEPTR